MEELMDKMGLKREEKTTARLLLISTPKETNCESAIRKISRLPISKDVL